MRTRKIVFKQKSRMSRISLNFGHNHKDLIKFNKNVKLPNCPLFHY